MFEFISHKHGHLAPNITQFNVLMLGELSKLHRRIEVLEADLAARKAKEAEAKQAESITIYRVPCCENSGTTW